MSRDVPSFAFFGIFSCIFYFFLLFYIFLYYLSISYLLLHKRLSEILWLKAMHTILLAWWFFDRLSSNVAIKLLAGAVVHPKA